jgi:DNA replication protein DnaC
MVTQTINTMEIKGRKAIEENLYRALTQQGQHEDAERPVYNRKLLLEYDEFIDLISRYGNYFLKLRGEGKKFEIDSRNRYAIDQLWRYITHDPSFFGRHELGIMVCGPVGTGKTLLMQAFSKLITDTAHLLGGKVCRFIRADDLIEQYVRRNETGIHWENWLLCIDEFGREARILKNYGNAEHPMRDLMLRRYATGAITHGTTNYSEGELLQEQFYGDNLCDRMKQMFNFLLLEGQSRR